MLWVALRTHSDMKKQDDGIFGFCFSPFLSTVALLQVNLTVSALILRKTALGNKTKEFSPYNNK